MKTMMISLNTVDKVKNFVSIVSKFDFDIDLISGRYVINAKSIMAIFSADLSRTLELNIHASDEDADKVIKALEQFLA